MLLKPQLRVRMQLTPKCGDLGVKRGDVRKGAAMHFQSGCLHQKSPRVAARRRCSHTLDST